MKKREDKFLARTENGGKRMVGDERERLDRTGAPIIGNDNADISEIEARLPDRNG